MSNLLLRSTLILSLAILLIAVVTPVAGQQRRVSSNALSQQPSSESATTVFRAARDLITDGEWAKAQDKFSEYVNKFPNEKNLDAALYWLAYSQHKLSRFDQCRETINRLFEKYENSTWRDDALLLAAQIPGNVAVVAAQVDEVLARSRALTLPPSAPIAQSVSPSAISPRPIAPPADTVIYGPDATVAAIAPPASGQYVGSVLSWDLLGSAENDDDPCEFKIVVLQALFETDVQRGIIAATEWLKPGSTQTVRCKSAALTLLGRHGGKSATPVILGIARSEPDVKLRARAISTLGATNDDSIIDPLREFALNATENEIVEAALYALSRNSNERVVGVLTDIAVSGKTTTQRRMAIQSIAGRSGDSAVDALFRIYDADQTVEIRKVVIAGFANRMSERAANKLFDIARTSDNVELRKAAIAGIPRRGGEKAIDFLISLYDTEKNDDLKDQIMNSFASGNSFYVPAVRAAGQGGPGTISTNVGRGPFSARSPVVEKKVIRKLIEIAKNAQEPMQRRKRAISLLSRSNDADVQRFLEELLRQ